MAKGKEFGEIRRLDFARKRLVLFNIFVFQKKGRDRRLADDLADDGKRSPALDVAFRAGGYSKGRGLGRGVGRISGLVGDLADDGKRSPALDVGL